MKSKLENTPIEKTRCGKCQHLRNHTCPKGNNYDMMVYPFFAEKCATFEDVEVLHTT